MQQPQALNVAYARTEGNGMQDLDYATLLPQVKAIALEAGEAVMRVYRSDFDVQQKSDQSPVTKADLDAEAIIAPRLAALTPDLPIVAEEAVTRGDVPAVGDGPFWLVDPVDGTKEFLHRNDEFTVNIGLVQNRRPVLGVVLAPALDDTLYAGAEGLGATRQKGNGFADPIHVRPAPYDGLTVIYSRRHGDTQKVSEFLGDRRVVERISAGSSLKFCLVAAGKADVYPRFGPTMEWDTAAAHAVLAAAGGRVDCVDGEPLLYGKPGFRNPEFVAWGIANR